MGQVMAMQHSPQWVQGWGKVVLMRVVDGNGKPAAVGTGAGGGGERVKRQGAKVAKGSQRSDGRGELGIHPIKQLGFSFGGGRFVEDEEGESVDFFFVVGGFWGEAGLIENDGMTAIGEGDILPDGVCAGWDCRGFKTVFGKEGEDLAVYEKGGDFHKVVSG